MRSYILYERFFNLIALLACAAPIKVDEREDFDDKRLFREFSRGLWQSKEPSERRNANEAAASSPPKKRKLPVQRERGGQRD